MILFFFFSSRRRHTRFKCDWSSDVCSSDLCADTWSPGASGGDHSPDWSLDVRDVLKKLLSSKPPSSYSAAASELLPGSISKPTAPSFVVGPYKTNCLPILASRLNPNLSDVG